MISTVYLRDEKVYIGLFDNFAKFHFIPFLAIAGIYMINEIFAGLNYDYECLGINTGLSLAGLVLLIIVYAKIKLASKWFLVLFIKKGTFSGLIMLLWGNITLNIYIFLPKGEVYPSIIFPIIIFFYCCYLFLQSFHLFFSIILYKIFAILFFLQIHLVRIGKI